MEGGFPMVKSWSACGRSATADEPRLCKVARRAARARPLTEDDRRLTVNLAATQTLEPSYQEARNSWLLLGSANAEIYWSNWHRKSSSRVLPLLSLPNVLLCMKRFLSARADSTDLSVVWKRRLEQVIVKGLMKKHLTCSCEID